MAVQQVLLARADSAKVQIPQPDRDNMYSQVGQLVTNIWQAIGVDPKQLADSAKSTAEKERLAASRADAYLDKMMAGQAQPISPPLPLRKMLDAKYEASVNSAGLDRALERAQKVRSSADSARTANQPKSEIPMPGAPGRPPEGAQAQPPAGQGRPGCSESRHEEARSKEAVVCRLQGQGQDPWPSFVGIPSYEQILVPLARRRRSRHSRPRAFAQAAAPVDREARRHRRDRERSADHAVRSRASRLPEDPAA